MKKLTLKEFRKYIESDNELNKGITLICLSMIVVEKLKVSDEEQKKYLGKAMQQLLNKINEDDRKIKEIRSRLELSEIPWFREIFGKIL